MNKNSQKENRAAVWVRVLIGACVLVILLAIWGRRGEKAVAEGEKERIPSVISRPASANSDQTSRRFTSSFGKSSEPHTPEVVVAEKLAQFARSRRDLAYGMAKRHNVTVPEDVERFFDAVESGDWNQIEAAFNKLNGGDSSAGASPNRPAEIVYLWPAIIDAYGAAEQVHEWPAQELLDYGNAILGSLRPGMVYVGGTDNGRWIPELLNETSEGERHIIITQNGLADATYLDYVRLQYQGQLQTLSDGENQAGYQHYREDVAKRLKHDTDFPDEPKRVRTSEEVLMVEGKSEVSGQVAVMDINERLLRMLMDKNPGVSFAIQESVPFKKTYADALPLGPIMELRASDGQNSFTSDRASESLDYWRGTAQQLLGDANASPSDSALKSYSHDAVAAANLLASHKYGAEAEEAYRVASRLWPKNPEAVNGLAQTLWENGRDEEARRVVLDFTQTNPAELETLKGLGEAWKLLEAETK